MDHMGASPELSRRLEASSSTCSSSSSSSITLRKKKKKPRAHKSNNNAKNSNSSNDDGKNEEEEDAIECSGRGCKSCTAGTIADCVAVCFCPCAVVHFLALALVKVPWSVGKRCLGVGRRRRQRRVEMRARMMAFNAENVSVGGDLGEMAVPGADEEEEEEEEDKSAEMVWMEMGQLGFGRVSFHGIMQSIGSGDSRDS
uniref:Uncharacterized protein n=1 Tax=Kalanchoe fedtschenkoi TaxID=63787 RepID=A0A7N0TBP0_KALFE